MSEKPPYICEPKDQSSGRPASFIFLHGYGDDAEGIPLGLAQQFQWHDKVEYLRWVLPNAAIHNDTRERAWYTPKALPNSLKPRVPGQEEDEEQEPDDEDGIMKSVDVLDRLVQGEIDRGVDPSRIIVGGFSQGCAITLVWGLTGKLKDKVGGVVCASGYFPLAKDIARLRKEKGWSEEPQKDTEKKKWLLLHGARDILVPARLFRQEQETLKQWVNEEDVLAKVYDAMGHSTCNSELRDILFFFGRTIPA